MKTADFILRVSDGAEIHVHHWLPEGEVTGVLLVAHGLAEHGARYARLAERLTVLGWAVYAPDHRGHGLTASEPDLGWFASRGGFVRVLDDLREAAARASADFPSRPLFLLGHSMGSLLAEALMGIEGRRLSGCILSGVIKPPAGGLLFAGRLLASAESFILGSKARSRLLDTMSFGSYNKAFAPVRTAFDWLSRDPAEVDKYVQDRRCGFLGTPGLFLDLFSGFDLVYGKTGLLFRIPGSLPVAICVGEADPVGGAKGFGQVLEGMLRGSGSRDLELRSWAGARHEILNETNRDEVMAFMEAWLEKRRLSA